MIRFECHECGKKVKAPDDAVGKTTRCPECGAKLTIPEAILEAEAVDEEPGIEVAEYAVEDAPAPGAPREQRRPCPACGEMIMTNAAKCRFCGEIFDPALKRREKKTRGGGSDDEDLTTADWILAIICSGIGCIIGIVWLIQGKPKAGKMIGVSVLAGIFWGVIRVILEQAAQNP